jgi:hypothetical protein
MKNAETAKMITETSCVRTTWKDYGDTEFRYLAVMLSRFYMNSPYCSFTTWRVI